MTPTHLCSSLENRRPSTLILIQQHMVIFFVGAIDFDGRQKVKLGNVFDKIVTNICWAGHITRSRPDRSSVIECLARGNLKRSKVIRCLTKRNPDRSRVIWQKEVSANQGWLEIWQDEVLISQGWQKTWQGKEDSIQDPGEGFLVT